MFPDSICGGKLSRELINHAGQAHRNAKPPSRSRCNQDASGSGKYPLDLPHLDVAVLVLGGLLLLLPHGCEFIVQ
eukprot:6955880-Pyramimonas_sp.AAC.1